MDREKARKPDKLSTMDRGKVGARESRGVESLFTFQPASPSRIWASIVEGRTYSTVLEYLFALYHSEPLFTIPSQANLPFPVQ